MHSPEQNSIFSNPILEVLPKSLFRAPAYRGVSSRADIRLDKNEMPFDWPEHIKRKVLNRANEMDWNRYPDPTAESLREKLAGEWELSAEHILLDCGTNALIAFVMDTFGPRCPVIAARPSFDYYHLFASYRGFALHAWDLDAAFRFDPERFPSAGHGVAFIASPNNPLGCELTEAQMRGLLSAHPQTLFVVDQAYRGFGGADFVPLVSGHENLVLLCSFSKSGGAAGLRIGAMCGPVALMAQLRKIQAPFRLNPLAAAALEALLDDAELQEAAMRARAHVVNERARLAQSLRALGGGIEVFEGKGNFVTLLLETPERAERLSSGLRDRGIAVASCAALHRLAAGLRITVGTPAENDACLAGIRSILHELG